VPKIPIIKSKELIRVLNHLGFFESHRVGSHAQFRNAGGKRVTVPIHKGKDLKKKVLRGIINDLEISVDEFIKFLK
jgi:predicted RNA binding protein YcfA (HicA-like mRNA interferase family)